MESFPLKRTMTAVTYRYLCLCVWMCLRESYRVQFECAGMSRVSEAARLKCSGEDECVLSHIFPLSDTGRMLEEERKIALVCRGQDSHPFQCLCDLTVKRRSRLLLHSCPPLLAASQCTCPHTHPLAFIHFLTISPRLYLYTGLERIHPPPHTTYYHTHTHTSQLLWLEP